MSNTDQQVLFYNSDSVSFGKMNGELACKFLLVWDEQCLSLLFGPLSKFPYHAFLLDRFCSDNQIPSSWVKQPDVVEVHAPHIHIRGGGWMEIDFNSKTVRLEGQSRAYGDYDRTALVDLVDNHVYFDGYEWSVE
jgi:hypothetical protein